MKHITLTLLWLVCALPMAVAQQADFQKAVAHYKNSHRVTATATRIVHKNALAKDAVDKGTLVMQAPSEVSITMQGGKDQLLMQGSQFTMTVKGKKHTTSSQANAQFASFQTVFESILSGGTKDIANLDDLDLVRQGNQLVLTITPKAKDKKTARRILFSSFVLVIDMRSSELRSLRMNEKAGYTEYTFDNYKFL